MVKKNNYWQLRNPSNWNELLDEIPLAREKEVNNAILHLKRNQIEWSNKKFSERKVLLNNCLDLILSKKMLLIDRMTLDIAKPRETACEEFDYGLRLIHGALENKYDEIDLISSKLYHYPRGIVGIISPWNNPFAIAIKKIFTALLYGNLVIWKPALPASNISKFITQIFYESGLGNFLTCLPGDDISGDLIVSSGIDAITFTGSTEIGKLISRKTAELGIIFQAEMGGSNAAVILKDCPIENFINDLTRNIFSFSGQRCTGMRRLYIEKEIIHKFNKLFFEALSQLKTGHPSDPTTFLGPLISPEAKNHMLKKISTLHKSVGIKNDIIKRSNEIEEDCWLPPHVISFNDLELSIFKEENFGPIVGIYPIHSLDEAILAHNQCSFGLLASIYTENQTSIDRFVSKCEVGMITRNRCRPVFDVSAPFYGWKDSSIGIPEHGRWDLDFFTKTKVVY